MEDFDIDLANPLVVAVFDLLRVPDSERADMVYRPHRTRSSYRVSPEHFGVFRRHEREGIATSSWLTSKCAAPCNCTWVMDNVSFTPSKAGWQLRTSMPTIQPFTRKK